MKKIILGLIALMLALFLFKVDTISPYLNNQDGEIKCEFNSTTRTMELVEDDNGNLVFTEVIHVCVWILKNVCNFFTYIKMK